MNKNYNLYTIINRIGRPGFGIATDLDGRQWHYIDHSGDWMYMPITWSGNEHHIRSLEKDCKRHFFDVRWKPHEAKKKREWLDDNYLGPKGTEFDQTGVKIIIDYIKSEIEKSDLDIKILHENYKVHEIY